MAGSCASGCGKIHYMWLKNNNNNKNRLRVTFNLQKLFTREVLIEFVQRKRRENEKQPTTLSVCSVNRWAEMLFSQDHCQGLPLEKVCWVPLAFHMG